MLALVLLIVAAGNAEGNAAAAEPAANEAKNNAENPCESTLLLINVGHGSVIAVLASDGHRVVGPVTDSVRACADVLSDDNLGARLSWHWLLHHGRSSRLLHHWLAWLHHWLLHHRLTVRLNRLGVWLLRSLVSGHAWGLTDKRLGLSRHGLAFGHVGIRGNLLSVHLAVLVLESIRLIL